MGQPAARAPERYSKQVLGSLNAGGTYDARHEVALSFGGQGSAGDMNNLFVYDAYANRLERLEAQNPPGPRDGMGLCYESRDDCLVVFGSQYGDDERTWIYRYRENRWEAHDLQPHPPGKKQGEYSTIPAEPTYVMLCEKGGKAELRWDAAAESSVTDYRVYRVVARTVERVTPWPIRETHFTYPSTARSRFLVVSVDALGQEGQPSSPAWCGQSYPGFFEGEWHQ